MVALMQRAALVDRSSLYKFAQRREAQRAEMAPIDANAAVSVGAEAATEAAKREDGEDDNENVAGAMILFPNGSR
jgi:hypothetical protein